tara:strand:- start:9089 stop:9655 length:567 start_codon:yes stop_codon:yes gene_type:complete
MGSYNTKQGDATKPETGETRIIPHVCNDIGGWGSGFVLGINNTFGLKPKKQYKAWHKGYADEKKPFRLGNVQFVMVGDEDDDIDADGPITVVANMIGQHLTGKDEDGRACIRYGALVEAMNQVGEYASFPHGGDKVEIHAPQFGSGLAGGDWDAIEHMIREIWVDKYGLDVTIYEFVPKTKILPEVKI